MKAFSDIFRSQICIQVGAHGGFPSICICSKDRFGRSRLRSLRHRRAAQGGASGGKQKSLRADTHADNKIMQHLLEKNGFTRCGVIHVADGSPRFAYQKLAPTQPLG